MIAYTACKNAALYSQFWLHILRVAAADGGDIFSSLSKDKTIRNQGIKTDLERIEAT